MPAFNINRVFISGEIADVSTASSVRFPIVDDLAGEVINVSTVLGGAITGADAVITVSKGNTSMGTITIANASSAEHDVDTLNPTSANRFLSVGDTLELTTSGASTNAVPVGFIVTIKR